MDRRSFFNFGRSGVLPQTPWDAFCHRVQRVVRGRFQDISLSHYSTKAAEIVIERLEDIQHLYVCCQEYGVVMALSGLTMAEQMHSRHVLIIRFSSQLNQLEPMGDYACLVQPSVLVGDLYQQGYQQFARVPKHWTIAQWFASPLYHDCRPYHSFLSGVERISVLFADGSQAVLGGFGVNDRSALSVPILNRCIPNLFELLREDLVEQQLAMSYWPYAYRIDALKKHFVDINLARVFQGHQGKLAWIQQWVIRKIPEDVLLFPGDKGGRSVVQSGIIDNTDIQEQYAIEQSVVRVNQRVKDLFDAEGVFLNDDEVINDDEGMNDGECGVEIYE
ncbi:hypothetical protein [Pelistega europaea]|uniref:Uncharacterized protein n=1 Tax=Pelistega europaea TaxID=106147 RepID=A0A7Y4LBK4_9BURK|nr:hypothetical protein [Pelistega europaea]NOL50523.1 hypothetical protein [Pelistega europaea]